MTAPTDLREKVARIVDPAVWKNRGAFIRTGHDFDRHASSSLAKADAILALIASEREGMRETPGALEAFAALDVADRIIEREMGVDVPPEWNAAYRKVAKVRAALSQGEGA